MTLLWVQKAVAPVATQPEVKPTKETGGVKEEKQKPPVTPDVAPTKPAVVASTSTSAASKPAVTTSSGEAGTKADSKSASSPPKEKASSASKKTPSPKKEPVVKVGK